MAKSAILHVLEETIGRYVLGLDAQSLNVAVWAGKIQLQSLQLDVQAVNHELTRQAKETPNLAIPFRIVDGSFESLEVDVPWARITSKPVVLRARGLQVVIEPYDHWKGGVSGRNSSGISSSSRKNRVIAEEWEHGHEDDFDDAYDHEEDEDNYDHHHRNESYDDHDYRNDSYDSHDHEEYSSDHAQEQRIQPTRGDPNVAGSKKKRKNARMKPSRMMEQERYQSLEMAEESRQRIKTLRKLGGELDHIPEEGIASSSSSSQEESSTAAAAAMKRDASHTTGFKARLVRRILENLQLEIDQVDFQIKGNGCDIGASVEKFSIFTTDKDGNKSFIDRVTNSKNIMKSFLYKALELEGLSVYCDEEHKTPSYLSQPYKPMDERYGKTYILSPLSFRARLRQSDCVKCIDFPKYFLSAELPLVSLRLTRMQLELVHGIMDEIHEKKHVARPLFPEYRPDVPIRGKNARLWWRYAVRSIGRITRRRSWVEFYLAYRKRKRYIDLYKRCIYSSECSWLKPLKISDRAEMDGIECDKSISTQGIMAWRNMADAQAELEMKKYEERQELKKSAAKATPKKKTSFRSMLFGRKENSIADKSLLHSTSSEDDVNDPPIALTDLEMKELDALALESASAEMALSSDSMLCDVSFEMGSFMVDLITFSSAPLVSLEMGTVLSSFKANADGSFTSSFSLSSLDVYDRITRKTLFPIVIRSLQSSKQDSPVKTTFQNAIELKLTKARNGDQHLEAKMVSYEIVACDFLFKELKKYVTIDKEMKLKRIAPPSNPILQYSVSGGADLFYDATEQFGGTTVLASTILEDIDQLAKSLTLDVKEHSYFKDKFSAAFAEAWKNKLERETVWSVQVDLHAPILVIPQSCIDPSATTLVVDLGTFHMKYGRDLSSNVKNWFGDGSHVSIMDIKIDQCSVALEHFSLMLTKAGAKDWLQERSANQKSISESVIDPVTFTIDVGLENGGRQRKCVFGKLERISFLISHSQIERIVSLLSSWTKTLQSLSGENEADEGIKILDEDNLQLQSLQSSPTKGSLKSPVQIERDEDTPKTVLFHFSFILQEFKVKIVNQKNESIEACLLMATASSTRNDDGSSSIHIQMGHFWILDYLGGNYPRTQRLVAHSRLPLPPRSYAKRGKYDILESFQSAEHLSIDSLADIKITKSSHNNFEKILDNPMGAKGENINWTIIDAKFSTLYLHWNPYAIRNIIAFQKDIVSLTDQIQSTPSKKLREGPGEAAVAEGISYLILSANMEAFDLCLNSAKDDLPIFQMTMSNTNISLHTLKYDEVSTTASVTVGDFRLQIIPQTRKKISDEYLTLLGLSPNRTNSLLHLEYGKGPLALKCCPLENFDQEINEMFMVVNLSPMRFVHIHAVILTLVEYMTEGVIGALADKVAESAVQAARDMANAHAIGNKIFHVNAQGFDFILPQSATSSNHFVMKAGNLDLDFISYPSPGQGEARIILNAVTMSCDRHEMIINDPISMKVQATMAAFSAQTPHDMATNVEMQISRISVLLTKQHYTQIMNTLDYNISETDTFLRDENSIEWKNTNMKEKRTPSGTDHKIRITHGGVEEVIIKRRLYIKFEFESLWLNLCGNSSIVPIASLAAVQANIFLRLLPDTDTNEFHATLLDLVAEDTRHIATGRAFTKLIQQINHGEHEFDVCNISYVKAKTENETRIKITLGSPRVVFIPDVVSDILLFFENEKGLPSTVEFGSEKEDSATEVERKNVSNLNFDKKRVDFILETDDCSLVFLDMGAVHIHGHEHHTKSTVETVVIRGKTHASAKIVSNMNSGELVDVECQIHGENFEVYSAEGPSLLTPVQILTPTKLSFFLSTNSKGDRMFTDLAFVSLEDLDVIISIRQYALILAIATSAKDAIHRQGVEEHLEDSLTENETDKINKLASALEKNYDDGSSNDYLLSKQSTTISCSSHGTRMPQDRIIKLKITIPTSRTTIVNDLQGIDEALFKLSVSSFLNNTEICMKDQPSDLIFHSHTYMLIHSDYYNKISGRWEKFLLRPWELDFKAVRGQKKNVRRKATTIDIESHPCEISFSEQFIISLKGAIAMWKVFSGTNKKALAVIEDLDDRFQMDNNTLSRRRSMARCAARSLTTALPYGVTNRSGLPVTFVTYDNTLLIEDTETHYFSFPLTLGKGNGGYRLYGQDSLLKKCISIIIGGCQISIDHLDDEIRKGKQVHKLQDGLYVLTEAEKTGKSLILHISSFMDIYNNTSLDFSLSLRTNTVKHYLGLCNPCSSFSRQSRCNSTPKAFGVDAELLHSIYHTSSDNRVWMELSFHPGNRNDLRGEIELPPFDAFRQMGERKKPTKKVEVIFSPEGGRDGFCMSLCFLCKVSMVQGYPLVEFFLAPRLILRNNMFVNMLVATPMPATHSKTMSRNREQGTEIHHLCPFDEIEIFHAGPSVALSFKCADNPVGGNSTGWNKLGWIDIPLTKSRLSENIYSSFPFLNAAGKDLNFSGGCDFYLKEEGSLISDKEDWRNQLTRCILVSAHNLGVDHTGDILFESWDMNQQHAAIDAREQCGRQNFSFSAFSSTLHKRRISILPKDDCLIRIIHLSIDSADGFRRSKPFCIENVPFCDGGIESFPILWEDSTESGYFIYRKLSSLDQSEIHVIPEFVVFNGGLEKVRVRVQSCSDILIDQGKMGTAKRPSSREGLVISVTIDGQNCMCAPVQVDQLGLRVVLMRSCQTGSPVGSLAIQTVLGSKDSRFVVKLGPLKHGNLVGDRKNNVLIQKDYLHFRIRWSQLEVTFVDTSKKRYLIENDGDDKEGAVQNLNGYKKVAQFLLERFTLDYQKLFKEDARVDAARSQFSAIIHSIHVIDCTSDTETTFLSSLSGEHNFLDMRIRTRGSGDAGVAKIDLLELKIAHSDRKANEVVINTNEAFLWNLLDIASRTNTAIAEFTSTDTNVEWDEETKSFRVEAVDIEEDDDDIDEDGTYRAPRSDMLLSVKKMYVWPSAFLVSFKRNPQSSRYDQVKNVKSAKLVTYFIQKLNFTVDKARLRFAGFSCNNMKGPPDRIIESIQAFYLGQLKKKLFTLLTATSIDEWRLLSGRDDGRESYVEGDILRTTGNLAGRSAGYIVKKVGQGIGKGLSAGTAEVGNGIQTISEAIGVGALGAGMNSLVSGIGEGVGNTVEGVGSGGNKIIKGAGKGVGHIVGGVGGGLQQVAMGLGKGVVTGDGKAILTGIGDGVTSIGTGVVKGTESVVTGAAEGVFHVGKGLFTGIASLGKGVGNAVQGKKPNRTQNLPPPSRRNNNR